VTPSTTGGQKVGLQIIDLAESQWIFVMNKILPYFPRVIAIESEISITLYDNMFSSYPWGPDGLKSRLYSLQGEEIFSCPEFLGRLLVQPRLLFVGKDHRFHTMMWSVIMPTIHIHAELKLIIRGDIPPLPHTSSCLFDYCSHGILMLKKLLSPKYFRINFKRRSNIWEFSP
jgi:hypothetical protein